MPVLLGDTKQRGELAEVLFMGRALRLGYVVSKPYGDSAPYDVVVGGAAQRLKRVQVKGAFKCTWRGTYVVLAHGQSSPTYTKKHIDVLAAYVEPEDAWYIIPVEAFSPRTTLTLNPREPESDEWGEYREAWWRLGRPAPRRVIDSRPRPSSLTTR